MVNLFSGQIAFVLLMVPFCVVTLSRSGQVFAHSRRRRSKHEEASNSQMCWNKMTFFAGKNIISKSKDWVYEHPCRASIYVGLPVVAIIGVLWYNGLWSFYSAPKEETSSTTVQTPKPRVKVHFWVYVFYSMVVAMVVIFPIEVYLMYQHCERQQAKQLERARSERARLRRLERRRGLRGGTEAIESREED